MMTSEEFCKTEVNDTDVNNVNSSGFPRIHSLHGGISSFDSAINSLCGAHNSDWSNGQAIDNGLCSQGKEIKPDFESSRLNVHHPPGYLIHGSEVKTESQVEGGGSSGIEAGCSAETADVLSQITDNKPDIANIDSEAFVIDSRISADPEVKSEPPDFKSEPPDFKPGSCEVQSGPMSQLEAILTPEDMAPLSLHLTPADKSMTVNIYNSPRFQPVIKLERVSVEELAAFDGYSASEHSVHGLTECEKLQTLKGTKRRREKEKSKAPVPCSDVIENISGGKPNKKLSDECFPPYKCSRFLEKSASPEPKKQKPMLHVSLAPSPRTSRYPVRTLDRCRSPGELSSSGEYSPVKEAPSPSGKPLSTQANLHGIISPRTSLLLWSVGGNDIEVESDDNSDDPDVDHRDDQDDDSETGLFVKKDDGSKPSPCRDKPVNDVHLRTYMYSGDKDSASEHSNTSSDTPFCEPCENEPSFSDNVVQTKSSYEPGLMSPKVPKLYEAVVSNKTGIGVIDEDDDRDADDEDDNHEDDLDVDHDDCASDDGLMLDPVTGLFVKKDDGIQPSSSSSDQENESSESSDNDDQTSKPELPSSTSNPWLHSHTVIKTTYPDGKVEVREIVRYGSLPCKQKCILCKKSCS